MKRLFHYPRLAGILLLLVLGLAKLPLEEKLTGILREEGIIQPAPSLSLRESIPQIGFAAALGGMRSLVASIFYLDAFVAFENVEWGKVDSLMAITTRLQPREPLYWDDASWHMAYNAASSYQYNKNLRATIRSQLFREHVQRGIDILDKGLEFLPHNARLLTRLGDIYRDRLPNPRKAADAYLDAHAHGAKDYYERMGAYELVKLDDRASWEKAYEIMKRYYDKGIKVPSILRDLPILEERLQIPANQRIAEKVKSP